MADECSIVITGRPVSAVPLTNVAAIAMTDDSLDRDSDDTFSLDADSEEALSLDAACSELLSLEEDSDTATLLDDNAISDEDTSSLEEVSDDTTLLEDDVISDEDDASSLKMDEASDDDATDRLDREDDSEDASLEIADSLEEDASEIISLEFDDAVSSEIAEEVIADASSLEDAFSIPFKSSVVTCAASALPSSRTRVEESALMATTLNTVKNAPAATDLTETNRKAWCTVEVSVFVCGFIEKYLFIIPKKPCVGQGKEVDD
jgi:hypothetical protein